MCVLWGLGLLFVYLDLFVYLFTYLGSIFLGFFYHCGSIVIISFNFISLMIHFIVELIYI